MVLIAGEGPRRRSEPPAALAVIWHELECGGYTVDLPLWRELAEQARRVAPGVPVLDIGAGAGRVTLDLARRGHELCALDLDPDLLAALAESAAGMPVHTVLGDARTLALKRRDFALCLAPMQTIQLLDGADERLAFLDRARAHMRPGGLLACAIVTELEEFDRAAGDTCPSPETLRRPDGTIYRSQAVSVDVQEATITIERERTITTAAERDGRGRPSRERNVVELDRLTVEQLLSEAAHVGLAPAPARSIAGTSEHVGSEVVVLRA